MAKAGAWDKAAEAAEEDRARADRVWDRQVFASAPNADSKPLINRVPPVLK